MTKQLHIDVEEARINSLVYNGQITTASANSAMELLLEE